MLLRRRAVLLLCSSARRTAVSVGSSGFAATGGVVADFSSPTPPPRRRNIDSAGGAADSQAAAVRAADGSAAAAAAPQHHARYEPHQEHLLGAAHSKGRYPLVGRQRLSRHGLSLGSMQLPVSIYVLAASVGLLYVFYYLTTYTYVLTTNVSPYRNSLFFHFPCDMAIIENKLTHQRHTVEVVPVTAPPQPLDDKCEEVDQAGFGRPTPAVVERRLHINAVLHRVFLYLQKTESLVTVEVQAEMAPYRFMEGANSVGKAYRASVGFLREDQLLPDIQDHLTNTGSSQRWWWKWWCRGKGTAAALLPQSVSGSSAHATCATNASATPVAPTKILLRSSVRLRDSMNGYQKGHIGTYEQLIHHLAQENIRQRYYTYVLARGMAKNSGLRKVYAEELIRNGLLSGDGVTLPELVPDVQQFADEVFAEVRKRFGDDVIVYEYTATMW